MLIYRGNRRAKDAHHHRGRAQTGRCSGHNCRPAAGLRRYVRPTESCPACQTSPYCSFSGGSRISGEMKAAPPPSSAIGYRSPCPRKSAHSQRRGNKYGEHRARRLLIFANHSPPLALGVQPEVLARWESPAGILTSRRASFLQKPASPRGHRAAARRTPYFVPALSVRAQSIPARHHVRARSSQRRADAWSRPAAARHRPPQRWACGLGDR